MKLLNASGYRKTAEEYSELKIKKRELMNDTIIAISVNTQNNEADEASLPPYQPLVTLQSLPIRIPSAQMSILVLVVFSTRIPSLSDR